MSIAVISSVYGAHDNFLIPVEQDTECEWIMVTDEKVDLPVWNVITESRPQLHPRLAAKVAKCTPERYTDADTIIWVDGNIRVSRPGFVSWCVKSLGDFPICQAINGSRATIFDEARASIQMPKYEGLPIQQQAQHYVDGGFPLDWGTWWTGLMIRSRLFFEHTYKGFGENWLSEMVRWTYQDQLSHPYLCWRYGIRPKTLKTSPRNEDNNFLIANHRTCY